jgi:hypothetical protein
MWDSAMGFLKYQYGWSVLRAPSGFADCQSTHKLALEFGLCEIAISAAATASSGFFSSVRMLLLMK